jgi:DNA-binding response OmpR family regulator
MRKIELLIVEDEALVAMDLEFAALGAGMKEVAVVSSCEEAEKLLLDAEIDVAILDIALPDGKSFGTAAALRGQGAGLVFHSGHAEPALLLARFPGAEVCIKPCGPEEVLAAVRKVR